MIRHIVLFKIKDEFKDEIPQLVKNFEGMKGRVEGLLELEAGASALDLTVAELCCTTSALEGGGRVSLEAGRFGSTRTLPLKSLTMPLGYLMVRSGVMTGRSFKTILPMISSPFMLMTALFAGSKRPTWVPAMSVTT